MHVKPGSAAHKTTPDFLTMAKMPRKMGFFFKFCMKQIKVLHF